MTSPRAPRLAVLTRRGSEYGVRLINALHCAGVGPDAVVVAADSLGRRLRLLRAVARRAGWVAAAGAALDAVTAPRRSPEQPWPAAPLERDFARLVPQVVELAGFDDDALPVLDGLAADWFLLGQCGILRPSVLGRARRGVLNAHPGWLPEFRGVHVAWWTLAAERPDLLGSTLHYVDAGVDTGAIVERRPLARAGAPRFAALEDRLYEDCIALLVDAARRLREGGTLHGEPQVAAAGRPYPAAPWRVRRRARVVYDAWRQPSAHRPG